MSSRGATCYRWDHNLQASVRRVPGSVKTSWQQPRKSAGKPASRPQYSSWPSGRLPWRPLRIRRGKKYSRHPVKNPASSSISSSFRQEFPSTSARACPRKYRVGPLIVVVVAALFFPPSSAGPAGDEQLGGGLIFSSALLRGSIEVESRVSAALLPPSWPSDTKGFHWTMEAQRITVRRTNTTTAELGYSPANVSQPLVGVAKGPPEVGIDVFADARASSSANVPQSHVLLYAASDGSLQGLHNSGRLTLQPNGITHWRAGSRATAGVDTAEVDAPRTNDTTRTYRIPAALVLATITESSIQIQGSFTLVVWEALVRLETSSGSRDYSAGTTVRSMHPNPTGLPSAVRERDYTLIELEATNATFELEAPASPVYLVLTEMRSTATGEALFGSAEGKLYNDRHSLAVRNSPLSIDGVMKMQTRRVGDDSRLASTIELTGAVISAPGGVWSEATAGGGSSLMAKLATSMEARAQVAIWSLGLVLLGSAALGARVWYQRAPTVERVEWAVLSGQHRRANRLSRRLARKRPDDPDALFLYGSTLLQAKKYGSLFRFVEPKARRLPANHRHGIAFLLAVAAKSCGDLPRALQWAQEAAREPEFRGALVEAGLLREPYAMETQSGYA